jgi:hypothetical protein
MTAFQQLRQLLPNAPKRAEPCDARGNAVSAFCASRAERKRQATAAPFVYAPSPQLARERSDAPAAAHPSADVKHFSLNGKRYAHQN